MLLSGTSAPGFARWCALGCIAASVLRSALTLHDVHDLHTARTLASTDELTGLANRRALMVDGARLVAEASARHPLALLLLDLDGFKEVNDTLGHHAGDALLRQVGPRLAAVLRPGDLLVRLGGDEFAVLLPGTGLTEAAETAHRLRERLLEPFPVADVRLHVGVSIGVAAAPVPATDLQQLMHHADVAMYTAKSHRDGVRVYAPEPGSGTGDRLQTIEELRAGLARGELEVYLQPQVAAAGGAVMGAEALVRWRHPVRGLLAPADLLPAAEQAGLLRPLTDTVLDLALAAASGWWADTPVPVAVNLSAANVTDLDLPAKVAELLDRHGLPPAALTLELVEDTLMSAPERGRTVLAGLRGLGVRTSIDDYGTGQSSLAHLRHLAADEIKLDRSLTAAVTSDARAAAVVRHTVALTHDLGLDVVAEGVEETATATTLAELGCDAIQGWCIAHPMPVADFRSWLQLQQRPLADDAAVV
ncbi:MULTISPECIES: putative bifunctional diguanylate cyclase/phosphodiesterase [unclassified Modestobacter]